MFGLGYLLDLVQKRYEANSLLREFKGNWFIRLVRIRSKLSAQPSGGEPCALTPLTEEEYGELRWWERARTMGVSKVRRAKIVLLSQRGLLVQEIAEKPRAASPECAEVGQPL